MRKKALPDDLTPEEREARIAELRARRKARMRTLAIRSAIGSGVLLVLLGTLFGLWHWIGGASHPATSGTVMLAALPIIIGIQCLIAFLHYDVSSVPTEPVSLSLEDEAVA